MSRIPFPDETWFEKALGFRESDYKTTQQTLQHMQATSSDPSCKFRLLNTPNNHESEREVTFGSFSTPTVQELRDECTRLLQQQQQQQSPVVPIAGAVQWHNISGDALQLHHAAANTTSPTNDNNAANTIFQAASQFNCLEFPDPKCLPTDGVTDYCHDHTQGPACAIACGAGTAFRNYLVPVSTTTTTTAAADNSHDTTTTTTATTTNANNAFTIGQDKRNQINTLQPILNQLQQLNHGNPIPIKVKNGYATSTTKSLMPLHDMIQTNAAQLVAHCQVGMQRDTQVTYPTTTAMIGNPTLVTQVYCSAIPVSYTTASSAAWEPLARVVLQGAYEATLLEGVRQYLLRRRQQQQQQQTNHAGDIAQSLPTQVYLTFVGGGVFGNRMEWIYQAMAHAHRSVQVYGVPLHVYLVHFGAISPQSEYFVQQIMGQIVASREKSEG